MASRLRLVDIDEFEQLLAFLKDIGVALLANLAFKFLPVVRGDILTVLFRVPLSFDPVLEASVVDVAYRPRTLASQDKRVLFRLRCVPAEPTLDCFISCLPLNVYIKLAIVDDFMKELRDSRLL